jgi:hypothetical protein
MAGPQSSLKSTIIKHSLNKTHILFSIPEETKWQVYLFTGLLFAVLAYFCFIIVISVKGQIPSISCSNV